MDVQAIHGLNERMFREQEENFKKALPDSPMLGAPFTDHSNAQSYTLK